MSFQLVSILKTDGEVATESFKCLFILIMPANSSAVPLFNHLRPESKYNFVFLAVRCCLHMCLHIHGADDITSCRSGTNYAKVVLNNQNSS